ncbi:hypothetical protein M9H77_13998 [Catharanthus roseus]|uniref:Uncharacterized protein n=1 Tax=Catharanthus roseus TaxID=4058 RepID=A0ACC0BM05_CATRO|nr:hypothetical protein M9H77_13998 [Catharanthus roseus]
MSVPKIETDKFHGKSYFVMWRRKMKAVLVQNKIGRYLWPRRVSRIFEGNGLSLLDVKNALKSKDLDSQKENKSHGENLYVRGRVDRREPLSHKSKGKGQSKS